MNAGHDVRAKSAEQLVAASALSRAGPRGRRTRRRALSLNFAIDRVLHHLAAGENVANAGAAEARVEHFRRGRVIQIRGDAAGHRQRGVGDHAADRRRQQQADVLLVRRRARAAAAAAA